MSEIPKPDQENFVAQQQLAEQLVPPTQIAELENTRLTGDEGSVSFVEMGSKIAEVASVTFDGASLIYYGIRARRADRRSESAGDEMEEMEHKQALYTDLAELGRTGERSRTPTSQRSEYDPYTGEPLGTKPRSMVERMVDRKINRRRKDMNASFIALNIAERTWGPKQDLKEAGGASRFIDKRRVGSAVREGTLTAREAELEKLKIDAQKLPGGNKMYRKAENQHTKSGIRFDISADQPISSRRRANRHEKSVGDIIKHHSRAEEHRTKAKNIEMMIVPKQIERIIKRQQRAADRLAQKQQKARQRVANNHPGHTIVNP